MAEFEAKVYRLTIEPHPNADRLELAVVGDYRSIVPKGEFKTGDLGVYIPEASICPDWLIAEMGLEGKLAGKQKNRVKAVKLRGVLSQGLVYPVLEMSVNGEPRYSVCGEGANNPASMNDNIDVEESTVVTEFLGITKYEPPIPVHMAGEVYNAHGHTPKYDIENYKRYPDVLQDGEEVYFTEKIHGTWCCFGYHPKFDAPIVTSKGLSGKGLAFKFNDANMNNLYIRALFDTMEGGKKDNIVQRMINGIGSGRPFYILGEIFGQGVQDLQYGAAKPSFRVFDIYIGHPGQGAYLDAMELATICNELEVELVPLLYVGPFSKEVMLEYTDGKETVSGEGTNIREGIVIKPVIERSDVELGRVVLKSVSEAYLLRKGGTEFN